MKSAELNIALRKADFNDLVLLKHWDQQPHVIDSDPNDDWEWESQLHHNPPWREQLIAEIDHRPVGFIQIIDPAKEESHYWGNIPDNFRAVDIWIGEKEDLGKGYGTKIMQLAINRCFEEPSVKSILVDPLVKNVAAHRFYEKLGFQFLEYRIFGIDHCKVYCLARSNWFQKNNIL